MKKLTYAYFNEEFGASKIFLRLFNRTRASALTCNCVASILSTAEDRVELLRRWKCVSVSFISLQDSAAPSFVRAVSTRSNVFRSLLCTVIHVFRAADPSLWRRIVTFKFWITSFDVISRAVNRGSCLDFLFDLGYFVVTCFRSMLFQSITFTPIYAYRLWQYDFWKSVGLVS